MMKKSTQSRRRMRLRRREIPLFLPALSCAALLILSGCTGRSSQNSGAPVSSSSESESAISSSSAPGSQPEATSSSSSASEVEAPPEPDPGPSYIDQAVQDTIAKFIQPELSEYEKAKAAFDYMIGATTLVEPVGLELWRIRGNYDTPPSFVENRSLSVLLYGIGMCEDYAAALTMLLRGLGLEAEYVPGLTYAADGHGLVDHAWTLAKIDGVWYHLDCQLEDNVTRRDTIRYKYFMRGDATMIGSHRWGQNLIDSGLLTAGQNVELTEDFLVPACPKDYPTPPPYTFTPVPQPDRNALEAAVESEFRAYERTHGLLEPLDLNIIPPVFGLKGYNKH